MACGTGWNLSDAVNEGPSLPAPTKMCSLLSPEECGARCNQVGCRPTRSSQKASLNPGNDLALFMEMKAHNYSENIRFPANSKDAEKYPRRWQGKIKVLLLKK